MTQTIDLDVVIVTHSRLDMLKELYHSLKAIPGELASITIVDSASTDDTPKWLKSLRKPNVVLNEENIGAPKGRNKGAAVGDASFILFLDDDMELPQGPWLIEILAAFDDPLVVICGPQLLRPDRQKYHVNSIIGGCMFWRRSYFEDSGGFGAFAKVDRFAYGDRDSCYSAELAGYKVVTVPSVEIRHRDGPPSPDKGKFLYEDYPMFEAKWDEVVVRYTGGGYFMGIPARDLTRKDLWEIVRGFSEGAYPPMSVEKLLKSAIYEPIEGVDIVLKGAFEREPKDD